MKRIIMSDTQNAQSILQTAAEALRVIGCQFVLLAEDKDSFQRISSDSGAWVIGALDAAIDDVRHYREMERDKQDDKDDIYGPAEP